MRFLSVLILFYSSLLFANTATILDANRSISLNFQDISVRVVLQLLADYVGVNIVVADDVNGNMSLRLHDVPWSQALDVILHTQGLSKQQDGDILLINHAGNVVSIENNPVNPANNILVSTYPKPKLKPLIVKFIKLNYSKGLDIEAMLKNSMHAVLSSRGKIVVDKRTNVIWLEDTKIRVQRILELIKKVDIPNKQVNIQARIVNLSKDAEQDLGIRIGGLNPRPLNVNIVAGQVIDAQNIQNSLTLDLPARPIDATPASMVFALAKLADHSLLDLELSALETEGRAKIIASPKLMTMNQETAIIESGEDIPYQESALNGATSVAFKKAVLSLKVTPQITPDGYLLMDILINQDSDSGRRVQGVPVVLTKSIKTSVLVKSGETIVLGGIYKEDKHNIVMGVPFLRNVPLLGALMRKKQVYTRNEELLIFITPEIV
jgi:type IV pilus assembly protein PilQ